MFGIYRDSYRFAEAATRQTIARREARSSAPTASLTELPSTTRTSSRGARKITQPLQQQASPGVISISGWDDMSSLTDSFARGGGRRPIEVNKNITTTPTIIEAELTEEESRIRQISTSIRSAIAEFESFEAELLRDIHAANDQARVRLFSEGNSAAAIRCLKRARRLQAQSRNVSHHIERLEVKLQALHCAERNVTVVHTLGGNPRDDVSLQQWFNELQQEVDTAREISEILDTPFAECNVDDETLLDELREEESRQPPLTTPREDHSATLSSIECTGMSPDSNATAQSEHSMWC